MDLIGKNGFDSSVQQEKGYQNNELTFLRHETMVKMEASII